MSIQAHNREHIYLLRRRREGKTDYKKRRAIILGRKSFVTVKTSCKNIIVQIIKPTLGGDHVIVSSHSRELLKFGWKGSGKGTSTAYLVGLLGGLKSVKAGVKEAILHTGIAPFVHGSRIAAALKGMIDGGLSVPSDEDAFPSEERIRGEHVAEYAGRLLQADKSLFQARFSRLIARGFDPKNYPSHFDQVKTRILKEGSKSE